MISVYRIHCLNRHPFWHRSEVRVPIMHCARKSTSCFWCKHCPTDREFRRFFFCVWQTFLEQKKSVRPKSKLDWLYLWNFLSTLYSYSFNLLFQIHRSCQQCPDARDHSQYPVCIARLLAAQVRNPGALPRMAEQVHHAAQRDRHLTTQRTTRVPQDERWEVSWLKHRDGYLLCLSQDLETGCLKLAVVKYLGRPNF